jgi:hypothetical protein
MSEEMMKTVLTLLFLLISTKAFALDLDEHKGKVVLVVNIATRCGYTGQLDGAKVTGFVGGGPKTRPPEVPENEVFRVTQQMAGTAEKPKAKINFSTGESVTVVDGPFSNFNGTVEDINEEKGKVKVLVSIFGRPTPVELDFIQVEKA